MRKFKVRPHVHNLTLPGAGMTPGIESGRPFAYPGEVVTERELGEHVVKQFDGNHERIHGLLEEIDGDEASPHSEANAASLSHTTGKDLTVAQMGRVEGLDEPWSGYDQMQDHEVVSKLADADPDTVERAKTYERLQKQPRSSVLDYEPTAGGSGS